MSLLDHRRHGRRPPRPRRARRRRPDRLGRRRRRGAGRRPDDRGGGGAAHAGLRRRARARHRRPGWPSPASTSTRASSLADAVAPSPGARRRAGGHRARHRLGRDRAGRSAGASPAPTWTPSSATGRPTWPGSTSTRRRSPPPCSTRVPGIAELPGFSRRRPAAAGRPPRRPPGRVRCGRRRPAPGRPAGDPRRGRRAGHRQPARDGRAGGVRRRGPRRPARSWPGSEPGPRGAAATGASWPSAAAWTSSASWGWPVPGETCSATARSARTRRRWQRALRRPAGDRRARCGSRRGSSSHHVRACTEARDPGRLPRDRRRRGRAR